MLKVSSKDTRTTPLGVALVSFLLTLINFTPCSVVSIVNFQQVNTDWVADKIGPKVGIPSSKDL